MSDARWSHSLQGSAASLVGELLPLAWAQLLIFEHGQRNRWSSGDGPSVLVRLTASLQERIASLVRLVRDHELDHIVIPLTSADHSWSARYIHSPDSRMLLDSTLCVSATEIWVESMRRTWRKEDPPECMGTARLTLREVMPIDCMPVHELPLPASITRTVVAPYRIAGFRRSSRPSKTAISSPMQHLKWNGTGPAIRSPWPIESGSEHSALSSRHAMPGRGSKKSSIDGRRNSRSSVLRWPGRFSGSMSVTS